MVLTALWFLNEISVANSLIKNFNFVVRNCNCLVIVYISAWELLPVGIVFKKLLSEWYDVNEISKLTYLLLQINWSNVG